MIFLTRFYTAKNLMGRASSTVLFIYSVGQRADFGGSHRDDSGLC